MIKCIITDIDGTLLNSQGYIGKVTKNELLRLKENCVIVLASGRHYRDMVSYIKELELSDKDQIVCCDGQYVCDYLGNVIWKDCFLSKEDAEEIMRITRCESMSCFLDKGDIFISKKMLVRLRYIICSWLYKKKIKIFPDVCQLPEMDIEKIVINVSKLNNVLLDELKKIYTVHLLQNGRCEILQRGVCKYRALKKLEIMNKLKLDESVYFGDDGNDMECFKNLKICIAMENAKAELKEYASFVSKSCNEDGVGYAIKSLGI